MPAQPPQYLRYWLVVHGSYSPGGDDHFRLSDLRGVWHRGTIPGTPGPTFADMLASLSHEPTDAWALEIVPEPDHRVESTGALVNTAAAMYDRWTSIDEVFGDSVVRIDTRFTFAETDSFATQLDDGPRVVPANTYGSPRLVADGRYDSPDPSTDPVDLWLEVVSGQKNYDPSTFLGMINDLSPDRYDEAFAGLPNHSSFVSRLRRLVADHTSPKPAAISTVYFGPQEHNKVADSTLLVLAQAHVDAKRAAIESVVGVREWNPSGDATTSLVYRIADPATEAERGELHYELDEAFLDNCGFAQAEPWTQCLREACYSIAASYDLAYWLTQRWSSAAVDLEPLYVFWRAGGRLVIGDDGVCHVSSRWI